MNHPDKERLEKIEERLEKLERQQTAPIKMDGAVKLEIPVSPGTWSKFIEACELSHNHEIEGVLTEEIIRQKALECCIEGLYTLINAFRLNDDNDPTIDQKGLQA